MAKYLVVLFWLSLSFSFAQSGNIKGKVTDSSSGLPLADLHVFIPGSTFQAFTDSLGLFSIVGVPEGKWLLEARAYGWQSFLEESVVKSGKETTLEISLDPISGFAPVKGAFSEKKRKKLLDQLILDFVGKDYKNLEIGLLNPDKVIFESLDDKSVKVSSMGPLFFSNNSSGYLVSVYFPDYMLGNLDRNTFTTTYFELPSDAQVDDFRKKTRLSIYENSPNRFLSLLMEGKVEAFPSNPNPSVSFGKADGDFLLEVDKPLNVNLGAGKNGSISFSGNQLEVKLNGSPVNAKDLELGGAFAGMNPILGLPSNFNGDRLVKLANLEKNRQMMEERVYVQTDRKNFWPGEKLYFKAYLAYGNPLLADEMSKVLHLELVDTTGYIWEHQITEIKNGTASGSLTIPVDIRQSTNFFLKAYTAWSRNYADAVHFTPIQVIDFGSQVPASEIEETSHGIAVFSDRLNYQGGDRVKMNIMAQDANGQPVNANLSISVTDLRQSAFIPAYQGIDFSLEMKEPNSSAPLPEEYPLEKGFVLEGQLLDRTGSPKQGSVKAFINGYEDVRDFKSDAHGVFLMPPATFEEEFEINLQATDRDGRPMRDISLELKKYSTTDEFVTYSFPKPELREVNKEVKWGPLPPLEEKEILMEEVTIEDVKEPSIGPMIYGIPDRVVEMEDVFLNGTTIQFIYALMGQVPGMMVYGNPPTIRFRGGEPLVLINGSPVNGSSGETVTENSGNSVYSVLESLDVFSIDKVEVVRRVVPAYGDLGRFGVISIFLKSGMDRVRAMEANMNQFTLFKLQGFPKKESFKESESYRSTHPFYSGLKPTLLWQPELITQSSQMSNSLEFDLNPTSGPVLVEVRGITELGQPLWGRFVLNKQK
ncbi:carboxypeptidase regulatory-like domain-containing protein [Algoriphagus confluentis]|uniref:TonB-dependent receptor plug domain-containing protein n=1 Tax=Algoriphagus confluentis TaxID=1697556 RepID=A0ABQ6PLC1_9BACT|nr:hypothetical protein Aconfl_14150 [Algoriphagus confluentis]